MVRLRADRSLCIALSLLIALSGCGGGGSERQLATQSSPRPTTYARPATEPMADRIVSPTATPMAGPAIKTAAVQRFDLQKEQELRELNRPADQGGGPGMGGDKYAYLPENNFVAVSAEPLSTFSIDVDTASYSKARMFLLEQHALPPVDSVRIEEFVNYFDYSYAPPTNNDPFAVHVEVAQCPWKQTHLLARVGLKGREVQRQRPACNLVFLLDVSGSMDAPNRLGLVQQSMRMLTSQLNNYDRVSIVVYAGAAGLVMPPTYGDQRAEIYNAIDRLQAGGSTNGGAGIQLAYKTAKENLISGGINRVILCTDGDFNVGVTSTGDLVRMAEAEAKQGVFLSVLGFGMGNHNDAMLEEISSKANGAYAFIDNEREAHKVFVEQINSTLVTIAKDVKIQIEFNPASVSSYRLIGYENRMLAAQDFNNDRKDAGEIGAGHTVTALYELVPHGGEEAADTGRIDDLKYQTKTELAGNGTTSELMTVKLRYKQPDEDASRLISHAVPNSDRRFGEASSDFRFAACVASFGMMLRHSAHAGDTNPDAILEIAQAAMGNDKHGHRREFVQLVQAWKNISHGEPVGAVLPPPPTRSYRPTLAYTAPTSAYKAPTVQYVYRTDHWTFAMYCLYGYMIVSIVLGTAFALVVYRISTRTVCEHASPFAPHKGR